MTSIEELKANPDSFVVVLPTSWSGDVTGLICESYRESWFQELEAEVDGDSDFEISAIFRFEDGCEARGAVEEPLPDLTDLAGRSYEPYAASELALLESHENVWRIVVDSGDDARAAARRTTELMSAFIDAGAFGAFIPQAVRLHSPRTVRSLTVDPGQHDALANIFVNAWHDDGWMRSRGLTAFGLPELETPVDQGLNAAYFRIMDIAANMIGLGRPYPPGAQLDAGPTSYRLELGPKGIEDDEDVPICGHFGVRSIMPRP